MDRPEPTFSEHFEVHGLTVRRKIFRKINLKDSEPTHADIVPSTTFRYSSRRDVAE
jgi:hypothetical protein